MCRVPWAVDGRHLSLEQALKRVEAAQAALTAPDVRSSASRAADALIVGVTDIAPGTVKLARAAGDAGLR
jgi:hypothetical protein